MTIAISVRLFRKADAVPVCRLFRQFNDYLKSLGGHPAYKFTPARFLKDGFGASPAFVGWVAVCDKKIIGYLIGHLGYETDIAARIFHIIDLYIDIKFRRHGAASSLINAAAIYARQHDVKAMFWTVKKSNANAIKFYKTLGGKKHMSLQSMWLGAGDIAILASS